jgi:hypothetical protein
VRVFYVPAKIEMANGHTNNQHDKVQVIENPNVFPECCFSKANKPSRCAD